MHTLHQVMLVVAIATFVIAAAGTGRSPAGSAAGSGDTPYGRIAALVAAGALVLGNLVALLPGAPLWFSVGVTVLTLAGAAALLVAALLHRPERVVVTRVVRPAGPRVLYAVPDLAAGPGVVDAEVVEEAPAANVSSIIRDTERVVVTAADLRDLGPDRRGATQGATYVAANVLDYVPAERLHSAGRAPRSAHFPARAHGAQATADAAAMRLRVLRAYGATGEMRGRLRSTQV